MSASGVLVEQLLASGSLLASASGVFLSLLVD
jgi:hypothetical protein